MDFETANSFLLELPRFSDRGSSAFKPGVERIRGLLDLLGHPEDGTRFIHVAGTNGKGSVASTIAAILTAAGNRVGLHTSPHLFSVAERMRVNGEAAAEAWVSNVVLQNADEIRDLGASFFEVTVAVSLLFFAEKSVDVAVVEAGLGGRLDATNALEAQLAVITSIGLDHTEILGATVEEIAAEKAGIVKPGQRVLSGARQPQVQVVIREICEKVGADHEALDVGCRYATRSASLVDTYADVRTPRSDYPELHIVLPGEHQVRNTALALRAAEIAAGDVSLPAAASGVAKVRDLSGLRGRLEHLIGDPPVFIDTGHNPDSIRAALEHLRLHLGASARLVVALGLMRDKDVSGVARLLSSFECRVVPLQIPSPRGLSSEELSTHLKADGLDVDTGRSPRDVIAWFRRANRAGEVLLITGSHQLPALIPEFSPTSRMTGVE